MSLSRSPAAYRDCDELFRLAADTPGGARAPIGPARSDAHQFQIRMNNYRTLLRDQTTRAYPPEHHLHGTSEFDHLAVTIKLDTEDTWWIYVRPHGSWAAVRAAEPIPDDEHELPLNLTTATTGATDNEPSDLE